MTHDPVNHPAHYTAGGIECIDAIREALGDEAFVAYCRGNAIKYLWRTGRKQNAAEDLAKAAWYCNRAATTLEDRKMETVECLCGEKLTPHSLAKHSCEYYNEHGRSGERGWFVRDMMRQREETARES